MPVTDSLKERMEKLRTALLLKQSLKTCGISEPDLYELLAKIDSQKAKTH